MVMIPSRVNKFWFGVNSPQLRTIIHFSFIFSQICMRLKRSDDVDYRHANLLFYFWLNGSTSSFQYDRSLLIRRERNKTKENKELLKTTMWWQVDRLNRIYIDRVKIAFSTAVYCYPSALACLQPFLFVQPKFAASTLSRTLLRPLFTFEA